MTAKDVLTETLGKWDISQTPRHAQDVAGVLVYDLAADGYVIISHPANPGEEDMSYLHPRPGEPVDDDRALDIAREAREEMIAIDREEHSTSIIRNYTGTEMHYREEN